MIGRDIESALVNLSDAVKMHDFALTHLEAITPLFKDTDIPVRGMLSHPLYLAIVDREQAKRKLDRRRAELDELLRGW